MKALRENRTGGCDCLGAASARSKKWSSGGRGGGPADTNLCREMKKIKGSVLIVREALLKHDCFFGLGGATYRVTVLSRSPPIMWNQCHEVS